LSLFFGVLEPINGELIYANAGHPPPYFFTNHSDQTIIPLYRTGMLLGVSADEKWEKESILISPGGGLFLYTDGITEGLNEGGLFYGRDRLKSVLQGITNASAETICSTILQDLDNFVGAETQSDDIAMIVIKRGNL
jgi:phosphoserine phosphatase RsbU/P